MLYKKCRVCEKIKKIDDFHKKKSSKDGHRNECKECVKNIQKKYKEAPGFKEKRVEYDKKRYDENREDILERKKEYRTKPENKERQDEYGKMYRTVHKDKFYKYRNENPHIIVWRSLLYSTLNRLGTKKQGHTIDELGYSAVELKEHIEQQFTPGMTWENHGEWHIDHIKGVINFDSDTNVNIVCALDNLQPLWATTREINGVVYEGNLNKDKYNNS